MSPKLGVTMETWSLGDGIPQPVDVTWEKRDVFFVFYSHGEDPGPWSFTVDLKVRNVRVTSWHLSEGGRHSVALSHYASLMFSNNPLKPPTKANRLYVSCRLMNVKSLLP